MYTVFTRNFYKEITDSHGQKKLVVDPRARRNKIFTTKDQDEARAYCNKWNSEHSPGKLSRKAEYTSDF